MNLIFFRKLFVIFLNPIVIGQNRFFNYIITAVIKAPICNIIYICGIRFVFIVISNKSTGKFNSAFFKPSKLIFYIFNSSEICFFCISINVPSMSKKIILIGFIAVTPLFMILPQSNYRRNHGCCTGEKSGCTDDGGIHYP